FVPRTQRWPSVPGPCVLVANHPTLIDSPAVLSAYPQVTLIVRHDFFESPWMAPLFRRCGHLDGGDGSPRSGIDVYQQMLDCLRGGGSLAVFPEGTRSRDGLGPFKRGAFRVACEADLPVVPVVLHADPPALTGAR